MMEGLQTVSELSVIDSWFNVTITSLEHQLLLHEGTPLTPQHNSNVNCLRMDCTARSRQQRAKPMGAQLVSDACKP